MNVEEKHPAQKRRLVEEGTSYQPLYLTFLVVAAVLYAINRFGWLHVNDHWQQQINKISIAAGFSFAVLVMIGVAERLVKKRPRDISRSYNLIRILRLSGVVIIAVILISFLNKNWYAAAVSLGLISLILGFALQSPIASFIGWFYIILRNPYKVGDRVQTGDLRGDVVEIGYMDTTLWEFGGDYMSNDIATGRLIRFPNSLVWQQPIYNYSWHKFPYIWNEVPFHIAYESDLIKVEEVMRQAYHELYGERMNTEVTKLSEALAATPVEEPDTTDYPVINFKIHDNTWVEALLTYLVEPKASAAVRTALIKKILGDFRKFPDQVLFPKSNSR